MSEAVVVRRLYAIRAIGRRELDERMSLLLTRRANRERGGGDFFATLFARVSKQWARRIVAGTLEGRIPYTRAMSLLGFRKLSAFDEVARRLGLAPFVSAVLNQR